MCQCIATIYEIFKNFQKVLAIVIWLLYNTFRRYVNGLSPNGKALDSDSSILGVRVPQAQLVPRKLICEGFFVQITIWIWTGEYTVCM